MMHQRFTQLQVGDTVPLDNPRGVQSGAMLVNDRGIPSPTWYALTTPPQKERAARQYLRAHDVYAFYPSEERRSIVKGRRRTREVPMVPGYIYARFSFQPQWHVIRELPFFSGVIAVGPNPYPMPGAIVRRLRGMTVEAELLLKAKRDAQEAIRRALEPIAGERATIEDGPLAGFLVDVTRVRGGVADYLLPGGLKGSSRTSALRREGVDLSQIPGYVLPASP